MTRSLIVVLLLAVCFLTGVVYGNDKQAEESTPQQTEMKVDVKEAKDEVLQTKTTSDTTEVITEEKINTNGPSPVTEKTASILEAGVSGFYEVVVEILYQVSQLFF